MLVPSAQKTRGQWSYQSAPAPGHVTPDAYSQAQAQAQPSQHGWLIGNLDVQAPPATWVKYPNKPCIEEFVPPNPPQALGEGRGKMLSWPTAAMCHDSQWTGANVVRQRTGDQDEPGPTGHQSFFRRQMLKQNRERTESGEEKQGAESPTNDIKRHRDISQEFRDLFDLGQRSPSMGTTSSDSYHVRSSGTSLGKRQRGHIDSLQPGYSTQRVMVHIQSSTTRHISSVYRDCDLPDNLTLQLPRVIQPSNPEQLKATLLRLTPMIVYAEFTCPDVCRTRGICVHYSFVLGCKRVPDGLICQVCNAKGNEKAVHAERTCARHNNRKLSSFTMNLAEDILATRAQSLRAHEILARSLTGDWDGVLESKSKSVDASSQNVSMVPTRSTTRQAADCDIAVSSIETVYEDDGKVAEKVKMCDRNEETKQDGNAYNEGDAARFPVASEEEQRSVFDDAYATEYRAFVDDAKQGFDNDGIW